MNTFVDFMDCLLSGVVKEKTFVNKIWTTILKEKHLFLAVDGGWG